MPESPPHPNVRTRLLAAGKALFAGLGYERTSTSAIARRAKTSESQLVRYFGGKAGLLEAIYNEGWNPLNEVLLRLVADSPDSAAALAGSLTAVLAFFRRDPDLAAILLFEGRRLRDERHHIALSSGYREFGDLFGRLIRRAQQDGTIPRNLHVAAVSSALMGAAEGMIRDSTLAKRAGRASVLPERAIHDVFAALVKGLAGHAPAPATRKLERPTASSRRWRRGNSHTHRAGRY